VISKVLILLAWALSAQASFFPENGPQLKTQKLLIDPQRAVVAERLLTSFHQKLAPLVSARGAQLVVIPQWEDERVNALASRVPGVWKIEVYGGLLKHPELDDDELTLVLCHELGHHLGGAPTASRLGWSACEGQADYWSASACASLLHDPESTALRLSQMYASQRGGSWPELGVSDETRVERTFYGYPQPQCRLDTLLAGFKGMDRPACWYATRD
jgi:hypothetical protein